MGTYSTRARGIWLDANDAINSTELAPYDFVIAKVGPAFHANVQTAYNVHKPLLMWYQFRPEIWEGTPLSFSKWPADQNICLNECRSWIMSGSSRRAIHGVIVDASEFKNKDDVFWLTMPVQNFMDVLWVEFKLPTYLHMNRNPITTFSKTQTGKDALYGLVAAMDGMSTTNWVNVDVNNVPLDSTKPVMDYNNSKVWFWLYKFVNNRILCNYLQGNKAQLYSDLNYDTIITDPVVPPVVPGTDPIIPGGDMTSVNAKLDAILAKLNGIFR